MGVFITIYIVFCLFWIPPKCSYTSNYFTKLSLRNNNGEQLLFVVILSYVCLETIKYQIVFAIKLANAER